MALEIKKLADHVGVEVKGVDASKPFDEETLKTVYKAWVDHSVLVLKGQDLTPQQFVEFSRQFGKPIEQNLKHLNVDGCPELAFISSEDRDIHGTGKRIVRGTSWHTDHSYADIPPKATMLYGIDIPSKGGDTQFVNMYAAYDALSEDMKSFIKGRRVLHVYQASRAPRKMGVRTKDQEESSPGTWQPLVRQNPDTGRKALYLNAMRMEEVEGLSEKESTDLLNELLVHCDQLQFQYSHKWRKGDVLIWDNRATLHQGSAGFDPSERRYLHRVMLQGEEPVLAN